MKHVCKSLQNKDLQKANTSIKSISSKIKVQIMENKLFSSDLTHVFHSFCTLIHTLS